MNERIALFKLTTLAYEFCLRKHHVFVASSILENQKVAKVFKRRLLKKFSKGPP
jgi:hypothetical protein